MRKLFLLLIFFLIFFSNSIFAAVYPMPSLDDDIVGAAFTINIKKGDSIDKIRMRYEISYEELLAANPKLTKRRARVGDVLTIPAQYILPKYRQGIVLNMPELRVYYFTPNGKYVYTFPVAMGRENWRTPTMITKVIGIQEDPTWYVPDSVHDYMLEAHDLDLPESVPPGPDNPLGKYAIYLARHGFLIHGTNQEESVGTFASSGCMRLSSEAIESLYEKVNIGTPVYIIHHAYKGGWLNGNLYLEVHSPVKLDEEPTPLNNTSIDGVIMDAEESRLAKIDWDKVYEVVAKHDGIPHVVGKMSN